MQVVVNVMTQDYQFLQKRTWETDGLAQIPMTDGGRRGGALELIIEEVLELEGLEVPVWSDRGCVAQDTRTRLMV